MRGTQIVNFPAGAGCREGFIIAQQLHQGLALISAQFHGSHKYRIEYNRAGFITKVERYDNSEGWQEAEMDVEYRDK